MVTGAATGIGLACAEAFARAGATVVMADINEPTDQAARLVQAGYAAVPYRCDVSDTKAVEEMIGWIVATYGRLDAAHNNAGIQTPQRPMAEITDEEFDRTVAVDLKGVWNCMRYEIRQMLRQGGGAIVNTSSQVALGWLLQKAPWIVPIPGTTKLSHLEENLRTLSFELPAADWRALEAAVAEIPVVGDRYNAEQQRQVGF